MTGGSTTVLVVDDEPAIRLLCRVNLELDGFEVLEASSVPEARERLAGADVDLVLLDLHLGHDRSHALIEECASRQPPVPVALVTGSTDLRSAREAGADAVLAKPFAIEELAALAQRLTARRAATR
ncbi:MAG TPA: response regulator [Gaiellaceae bacterium]|nr:response regulator [Gaiellaceae bacterium]